MDRNEIIPVDRKHKRTTAIDPATGQPYFFWFVDNQSHSAGTFESPFPLVDAQNASHPFDIIYVYPGDGTKTGMDMGFVMQDNQKIWGAGIDHPLSTTLGTVIVPAMANALPLITNTVSEGSGITLANSCEVAGLHIDGTSGGAAIGGNVLMFNPRITNALIQNNVITNCDTSFDGGAIALFNCLGNLTIINNQISNIVFGDGIFMQSAVSDRCHLGYQQ